MTADLTKPPSYLDQWRDGADMPALSLLITEPYEHIDRTLATASWYDRMTVKPGRYPVRLTNIDYRRWNADRAAKTPGFIANTGPYYALVTVDVTVTEEFRVNRLLNHESAETTRPHRDCVHTFSTYAYNLRPRMRLFGGLLTLAPELITEA